ncbi:serine/threonine-protein phosphatase 2A 56 kDa regulatory subunit alpha isoform-like isoform X1 [Drosophila ficusphila]|uniref:serine/threonine-protein phosphatase 2A 56 kDa regulatory subunit alpha isoform-like isoform X1 n=1 Tax=Drosophila ficusphila TaxID=30025 RepID=UPI0007E66A2C|nr:serine/threonine-protein phosphatase 2A 56 kDa regulatory subunit alpha isoform-like isoform X1 [Drosophila ficusphila]XP_017048963.1 serine/threonine-protein phosphatase 2A 56 kDa regulatory subunit alpha isoform-like isoform X1 [Drosophila ficusphila]
MCSGLRAYIQSEINNVFFRCIHETEQVDGIPELLEVFAEIIGGYEVPLRAEQEQFLVDILLPMHKLDNLEFYHTELVKCITQYLEKNNLLAGPLIVGLLRFWPKMSTKKEVLFIEELEGILEMADWLQFDVIQEPLFRQIAKCMSSTSSRVAEQALYLWVNPVVLSLVEANYETIMPIVFPALHVISHNKWVEDIMDLALQVLCMFLRMDKNLFKELAFNFEAEREKGKQFELEREMRWKKVYELEAKNRALHSKDQKLQSTSQKLKFEFKMYPESIIEELKSELREPKHKLHQIYRPYAGSRKHTVQMKSTIRNFLLNVEKK